MVVRNKSRYGKDQHNATLVTTQQALGSAKIDLPIAAPDSINEPVSLRPGILMVQPRLRSIIRCQLQDFNSVVCNAAVPRCCQ
jgi:hypothetical protein